MNEYIELIDKWERERTDEPTVSDGGLSRVTKVSDDIVYQRLMNKEKLLEKRVYTCHRGKKRTKARKSADGRRPVESKKDIACQYEMWGVRFASEPSSMYFFTMHGHTGHEPATDYKEMRWLRSNDQTIEKICSPLFDYMTPGQILDHLTKNVIPGDFSNPLSTLTIPHITAIQRRYWRKTRISEKDADAVRMMIQSDEFPLLSCSDRNLQQASRPEFSQYDPSGKFHIAISSQCQALMLKKFGDLVFLDTVHGMTKYGYYNMAMLVMDEFGHGFPVAFMLSGYETAADWTFFIKAAFQKAGRDPSKTTFMIDKSSALIAAIKNVGANYLLCIFHMMQEIDRRLNEYIAGLGKDEKKALKGRIHKSIRDLRRLEDGGMFRIKSEDFKTSLKSYPLGKWNAEGFVSYYQKNWEACADKWAACGRAEFKHLQQDTNNLIESFFNQLRSRYCRRKKTRLDEYLSVLVTRVIPQYLRKRANIQAGIVRSKNEEQNSRIESKVIQLVQKGKFKLVDYSIGQGYVHYEQNGKNFSEWFCMAELSCTCHNHSGACVHIEAASRYLNSQNRDLKYHTLFNHAQYLRENSLLKIVEPSTHHEVVAGTDCVITHEADSLRTQFRETRTKFYIDAHRGMCSCPMYVRSKVCPHALAVLTEASQGDPNVQIDGEATIPAHIFQHPRHCSNRETETDQEISDLAKEECQQFQMLPRAGFEVDFEKESVSECNKLIQICRRIPIENQGKACAIIQELRSRLEELSPQLPLTFTQETVTVEKKQKFSRCSTDRKFKPLFPSKKRKPS